MGETLLRTTGARILALLNRRDMTQKQLARQVGVSEQFVSDIIKGKKTPNVQRARQIAAALDTSVDYITLAGDDPAPTHRADTIPDEPHYWHAETDAVAALVDAMPQEMRVFVLEFVQLAAAHLATPATAESPTHGGAWGELAQRARTRQAERVQP